MKFRVITCISILIFPVLTMAQAEKPLWISVNELISQWKGENDVTYLSNALYRCSALASVVGNVLIDDGFEEVGENYLVISVRRLMLANLYSATKKAGRGVSVNIDEATYNAEVIRSDMFKLMLANYTNWLSYNYVTFGEYTSEPDFQAELLLCNELTDEILAL